MTKSLYNLRAIPLWAAVVPLVTINVCFVIAVSLEHVSGCIPYLTGCTSVSSTGRAAPESLIFRAGMLPTAVILAMFWHHCATFLELGGYRGRRLAALRVLGVIAALSLTIYALTLGFEENVYRQLRRAGIIGFAVSTFAAEVMLIMAYRPMRIVETEKLWRWLVILCIALPAFDIVSELLKWAGTPRRATNNTVAWNAFVVSSLYYVVVARIWSHHGFGGQLRINSSTEPKNTSAGRPASPIE